MEMTTQCPECDASVALPTGAVENELVSCPDCSVELEVMSLDPPKLAPAPQVEEDWGE